MIIKNPESRDISLLRQLWKNAFGDTDAFLDKFFETGFSFDRCRILTVDGNLAAGLYWFDCLWDGKKVAYLYAVATDEAYQNKGLCRALMEDTHRHLKQSGYHGAALVPGNEGLFSLYEKFGYRSFCPMETKKVPGKAAGISLQEIDADTYNALRKSLLPADSLLQEGATLSFLATFAKFYQGDNCLLSAYEENGILHICEYFGQESTLGNIAKATNAEFAVARIPGGNKPTAMYLDFTGEESLPEYLGIPLN